MRSTAAQHLEAARLHREAAKACQATQDFWDQDPTREPGDVPDELLDAEMGATEAARLASNAAGWEAVLHTDDRDGWMAEDHLDAARRHEREARRRK